MGAPDPITFYVDENLPVRLVSAILTDYGHRVEAVQVGFRDQAILATAERNQAVIITADVWFLRELFRYPTRHHRRLKEAGVIQVPGDWSRAEPLISEYLPVIEAICRLRRAQADHRVGVDLTKEQIRIIEAKGRRTPEGPGNQRR